VSYLTLLEVIERIKRTNSAVKDQRTENNRTSGPSHCPEFDVPRIVKLLAHITLNTRA
jgi:hypothetical protein